MTAKTDISNLIRTNVCAFLTISRAALCKFVKNVTILVLNARDQRKKTVCPAHLPIVTVMIFLLQTHKVVLVS